MTTSTQTIPAGYKQTEIGVIPADWDVKELQEIVKANGLVRGPFGGSLKKEFFVSTGYRVYEQGDAIYGKRYTARYFIDKEKFQELNRFRVFTGDFILSCSGTIGRIFQIPKGYPDGVINQALLKIDIDVNKIDPSFFEIYFKWDNFQKKIIDSTQGGAMKNLIGMVDFKKSAILFPPKPEQTVIATALSDADALIEKLEKLITKKKAIKQGAMQHLLTAKKRLPGFSGEWEVKKLNDVTWFQEGPGVRTSQFTQSGVKLLNGTNIFKGKIDLTTTDRYISEREAYGPYSHFMADEEDIVIASSGITIDKFEEKIAFVKKRNLPFCMNTSTIRFKVDRNLLIDRFLYYFLMTNKFKKQIGAQATGSAQLNFGPSHLEKVMIDVPNSKDEQTAIATTLSDMDSEIEKLENKLSKYRQIKTGMMQQLLTGKIRLVKN